MPKTGQRQGYDPGSYNPYSMPPGLQQSQDRRWQLAAQRRQQDIGGVYAGKEAALERQAAKHGFMGAGTHGQQAFSLASAGAAAGTQALREVEAERAKEELGWATGERQYQQQLGLQEQGFGFQARLQKQKGDLDMALQEGRLTHEEYQNELNRLHEEGLQESEQDWQSGESGLDRAQQLAMQGNEAELKKYLQETGLDAAAAEGEANRLLQYAELEQQGALEGRRLDIMGQGQEYEHERGMMSLGIEQQRANDVRDLESRGYDIKEAQNIVDETYRRWARGEDTADAYGLRGIDQIHEMAMFDKQFAAEMEKSIATLMAETYAARASGAYSKGDVEMMERYIAWLRGGSGGGFSLWSGSGGTTTNTGVDTGAPSGSAIDKGV